MRYRHKMRVDRGYLFRPLRDILNFFVYRKYVKKFDLGKKEDRIWLWELKRNIQHMGFNYGVETFETWYEGSQKIGRSQVQRQLAKSVKLFEQEEKQREQELMKAKKALEHGQKEERRFLGTQQKDNYDPDYVPTIEELMKRTSRRTLNRYHCVIRKEYDIPDKGIHVAVIEIEGIIKKIIVGQDLYNVTTRAIKFEDDYATKNNLSKI